jgi:NADH dehydrogenase/NADH:ubiquinone oxidoreductase subunit G
VLVRNDDSFAPTDPTTAIATATARLQTLARAHGPGAIGVVVSAKASNEEIWAARRLGAGLGATVVGISWSPADAFADDFLIKADKNPNTQGLLRQGLTADAASVEKLLAASRPARCAGSSSCAAISRAGSMRRGSSRRSSASSTSSVLDSEGTETAQCANVVLPIGTYPESDGTFTNHAGRVQRFHQAVTPAGQARPGLGGPRQPRRGGVRCARRARRRRCLRRRWRPRAARSRDSTTTARRARRDRRERARERLNAAAGRIAAASSRCTCVVVDSDERGSS